MTDHQPAAIVERALKPLDNSPCCWLFKIDGDIPTDNQVKIHRPAFERRIITRYQIKRLKFNHIADGRVEFITLTACFEPAILYVGAGFHTEGTGLVDSMSRKIKTA
jgi:hypothetical protein